MEKKELIDNQLTDDELLEVLRDAMDEDIDEDVDVSGVPTIPMDIEGVMFAEYDTEQFLEGVASVSHLAGQITGLRNVGMSESQVIQLITLLYDKELLPQQMGHNLELAKIQSQNMDKTTI